MSLIDKKVTELGNSTFSIPGSELIPSVVANTMMSMAAAAAKAALGIRFDPIPKYLFAVEITGVYVALFQECSGVKVEREIEKIHQGGINDHAYNLPKEMSYGEITLKRGLTLSRQLWDWFNVGRYDLMVKRCNMTIIQGAPGYNLLTILGGGDLQASGGGYGRAKVWNLVNAYPIAWELSELDANDTEHVAIEEMKICHEGMELDYEAMTPMSRMSWLLGD
jgi:phage tail-like protein